MSELVKRLHDAENLCNKLGFSGSARAIFDARKRITELEASLADSNEALQVLGLKLEQAEADVARVQAMHEGLMKNADQMNAELEAENARLWAGHERYEIVRRLNAHQFTELFRESISKNKRFDDLVDAMKDQSHSANTVGGPTPGAAPACASERSVSESIAAGHPCFDPDGPPDHDWKYVDDSFSHEFGTEICGHYECARCDAIKPE